jgi:hypothetical protein
MVAKSSTNAGVLPQSFATEAPASRRSSEIRESRKSGWFLVAALAICSLPIGSAQVAAPAAQSQGQPPAPATKPVAPPFHNQPSRIAYRARIYYEVVWGIENPTVKLVEAGEMIRFTYRIVDAEKAKPLNDKKVEPSLICPDKSVKLIIPTLEKVGQLRQSSTPENGRSYWMAFSNKGGIVKRGDRVDVVIGNFHAEGLEVE